MFLLAIQTGSFGTGKKFCWPVAKHGVRNRELVKPADAVKWFALEPKTPANVIEAPLVAAAA